MDRSDSSGGAAEQAQAPAEGPGSDQTSSAVDSMLRKVAHVSQGGLGMPLPRPGQVIGEKYRIDARLGRGGMGVVFRATHVVSRKAVALKWMLRSTTDSQAHRRFLREALAAGRIDHPNVVDVYDVGQEGLCAYLVMELLHGESLRARLERGRLDSPEAIDLLLPVLRGVSAAHRAGVIHRDLKPDNIFLCQGPDGAPREAKVLDFGVSAVVAQSTLAPTLTDGTTILGTPAYMSPEQLAAAQDTDERTDVYAFGVILYEALTGRLPFVADSYSGLVLAVAHEPPPSPRELCPGIPRELERVILQSLAKSRQERPQSVEALRALLEPFGSHAIEGARAAPSVSPRRSRFGKGPSWLPVAGASVVATALLLRAGYVFWRGDGAAPNAVSNGGQAAPLTQVYSQAPRGALLEASPTPAAAPRRAEGTLGALALPRSCEEARRAGQTADGLRSIDPDGAGPLRAFQVQCVGMASAPNAPPARDYLPLAVDPERNRTHFQYGDGPCPCPDLVRRFTHVRLEPSTLVVDASDGTYATYDRPLRCEQEHRSQCGESVNLAWGGAGSCLGAGDTSGSATMDLSGTGFALAPDLNFVPAGFGAAGSTIFSSDRRRAQLSGGGLCGSLVPEHGGVRLVVSK